MQPLNVAYVSTHLIFQEADILAGCADGLFRKPPASALADKGASAILNPNNHLVELVSIGKVSGCLFLERQNLSACA